MNTLLKYCLAFFLVIVAIAACKKTNSTNANVLFYNGTWSLSAITASWNNASILSTPIAQGQSSRNADTPYIQVQAGTNQVTLKTGATTFADKFVYASATGGSSFIFFDTTASTGKPSVLQLTDDLTLPDTFHINYRILHLVPDTSVKVDIWLVNGATDSVRLDTAGAFIGKTAAASGVQGFTSISYHANSYTIKVKKTGTQELYASIATYPFVIKGIYSIIFSGLPSGTGSSALKLSVLHHRT